MVGKVAGTLLVGLVVRLFLFQTAFDTLSRRNELVTPLTSFHRGVFHLQLSGDPYDGDAVHSPPLLLFIFDSLLRDTSATFIKGLYIAVDLLAGLVLYQITKRFQKVIFRDDMKETIEQFSSSVINNLPLITCCVYLFNPMIICTCVAMSTSVFVNLAVLLMIYMALCGQRTPSAFFCAAAAYLDLYPALLAMLIGLITHRVRNKGATAPSSLLGEIFLSVALTGLFLSLLLGLSYELLGSWKFLEKSYGFILLVSDLQPNVGLFWYFFAEVFAEFRSLFTFCFQFHLALYPIPLAYRLNKHPVFVMWIMLAIISAFKSYPAFGDIGLYLSLLPLFYHKLHEFEYGFLTAATFLLLGVLYPIMWHMWIMTGTGNANFYYALTLATAICNGYIISDSISALNKRKYLIKHAHD